MSVNTTHKSQSSPDWFMLPDNFFVALLIQPSCEGQLLGTVCFWGRGLKTPDCTVSYLEMCLLVDLKPFRINEKSILVWGLEHLMDWWVIPAVMDPRLFISGSVLWITVTWVPRVLSSTSRGDYSLVFLFNMVIFYHSSSPWSLSYRVLHVFWTTTVSFPLEWPVAAILDQNTMQCVVSCKSAQLLPPNCFPLLYHQA